MYGVQVNVCSVQWSPEYPHLLAAGASNCKAYLYDLRRHDTPLGVIPGHSKSVSYVRHASGSQLLTASTDSTVRLWDVTGSSAGVSLADVMHDVEGSGGVDGDAKGAGPSAAADAAGGQANGAAGQWGSHSTPRLAVTPRLTYRGHINERNFVGLSVSSEGYIACGSEDNSVYVYCQVGGVVML
jgi:protein suppressor of PHYA-105 1